jgi:16S rRNA (cytosine967-C5)-methyltransferase
MAEKDSFSMQLTSLVGHTQELLGIVLQSKKPADSLIDTFFRSHKYLGSHDRKFIAETTYGTLRHLRKCEYYLAPLINNIDIELLEEDRILLLVLAYLSLAGKIKDLTSDLVASKLKTVRLREKITEFLSNPTASMLVKADSVIERIGIEQSFPDWMVLKFVEYYGESEAEKICKSLNEQAPVTLRVNTLKSTVEQCQEKLQEQGIESIRTPHSPIGLNLLKRTNVFSLSAFKEGYFEVQDEGSQLLPLIIDPKPNVKLLDACAGAGGKTLAFAALMKNRGEIYATDIQSFRLDELRKRTKRAGAQNVRVQEIRGLEDLAERYTGFFDIVFVDAPCSGLGTIRRNPGMKWLVNEQTVHEVAEKQSAILQSSAPLLKTAGTLVYATCTLLRQENEDIIERFLLSQPEFQIRDMTQAAHQWNIADAAAGKYVKLLPHVHGTDGFFCAVLERLVVR